MFKLFLQQIIDNPHTVSIYKVAKWDCFEKYVFYKILIVNCIFKPNEETINAFKQLLTQLAVTGCNYGVIHCGMGFIFAILTTENQHTIFDKHCSPFKFHFQLLETSNQPENENYF